MFDKNCYSGKLHEAKENSFDEILKSIAYVKGFSLWNKLQSLGQIIGLGGLICHPVLEKQKEFDSLGKIKKSLLVY